MTPVECVDLVEFIADRCPAQKMREHTADTWYIDLAEHEFTDAIEAARQASRDHDFVSLAALIRACEHVRDTRLGRERRAHLDAEIQAADHGEASLQPRPLRALLAGTPLKPMPRTERWPQHHAPVASKPPLTAEQLAAAKAELDAAARQAAR